VEDSDALEAGGEPADGLRGEGDFGDEDDGLFAGVDDLADAAEVDFGFAGAGDAVEEGGGEAGGEARLEGVHHALLIFVELVIRFVAGGVADVFGEAREVGLWVDGDETGANELADGGRARAGFGGEAV
jgi:hypothetical protein